MFKRSDESLIKSALKGDQQAWQQLISRHESALFYFGVRLLGSAEDARDLLQDVLVVLCRNLGEFRGESSFKSWLFSIANYRAVDMLRKRRINEPADILDELPDEQLVSHESQLSERQQQQQVQQQLRRLPPEQRLVLELKFYQQFTFDEIAEQLGVSANTAKSRFYAALDKMRLQLEVTDA